jgi:bifunctional DNA-binding transcriptional regulator/antitoxin component of YhaV-PrlF toxin-antitoxin module
MVIPAKARKQAGIDTGDVLSVEPEGDGRIVLLRLERPRPSSPRIRLVRRKGRHTVLTGGAVVTPEQIRAALAACP